MSSGLVFLVSLPRSGSTMLQRMLAANPDVATISEPWLMLPLVYTMRAQGHMAEYDTSLAIEAQRELARLLPEGMGTYRAGIRTFASTLYDHLRGGQRVFLDKTPRYYLIVEELHSIFPDAHIIVLTRDPMSVLASILNTWVQDDPAELRRYEVDLVDGPGRVARACRAPYVHHVAYESLLSRPRGSLRRLCNAMGLEYVDTMVEYGRDSRERFHFGDQSTVYRRDRPDAARSMGWQSAPMSDQTWRWMHDYIGWIDPSTLAALGGRAAEAHEALERCRPPLLRRLRTRPLHETLARLAADAG